jgi:transposase InsO family protein
MAGRANSYDNAKAESFMKTLKVEELYLMAYENLRRRGRVVAALHRRGPQ